MLETLPLFGWSPPRPHLPSLLQVPFLLFLNLLCNSLPPHGPTTMLLCSTWSNSSICCHQQFLFHLALSSSSCLPLGVWLRGFQALSLSPCARLSFPLSQGSSASLCHPRVPTVLGPWVMSLLYIPRISFLLDFCLIKPDKPPCLHAAISLNPILEVVIVSLNQLNWIKYYSKFYSIQ